MSLLGIFVISVFRHSDSLCNTKILVYAITHVLPITPYTIQLRRPRPHLTVLRDPDLQLYHYFTISIVDDK